jgi:hypothetical protein
MSSTMLNGSGIDEVLARIGQVEALQDELREHVEAIQDLMGRIASVAGGRGAVRRGRGAGRQARGRKPTRPSTRRARRGGKRAPRGALKAAIHKVLADGKAARPTEVVEAVRKMGLGSTYSTVYLALTRDKGIRKTGEGFKLKASGAKSAEKEPAKKAG